MQVYVLCFFASARCIIRTPCLKSAYRLRMYVYLQIVAPTSSTHELNCSLNNTAIYCTHCGLYDSAMDFACPPKMYYRHVPERLYASVYITCNRRGGPTDDSAYVHDEEQCLHTLFKCRIPFMYVRKFANICTYVISTLITYVRTYTCKCTCYVFASARCIIRTHCLKSAYRLRTYVYLQMVVRM